MSSTKRSECEVQFRPLVSDFTHPQYRKPVALPVEHIVLLIDCIVAISAVNSGLFIRPFVPNKSRKHKALLDLANQEPLAV